MPSHFPYPSVGDGESRQQQTRQQQRSGSYYNRIDKPFKGVMRGDQQYTAKNGSDIGVKTSGTKFLVLCSLDVRRI